MLQSNQLTASEKNIERLEKDFNDTLAQLRFCKQSAERDRKGRITAEARLARQEAENDAIKTKFAHIESVYGRILQHFEASKSENREETSRDSSDTSPTASEDSGLQQTDTSEATQYNEEKKSPLTVDDEDYSEAKNGRVQNDATAIPPVMSVLPSVRGKLKCRVCLLEVKLKKFKKSAGTCRNSFARKYRTFRHNANPTSRLWEISYFL